MGITDFIEMSNYTLQDHNPSSKANGANNFGKGHPLIRTMIMHVVSFPAIILENNIFKNVYSVSDDKPYTKTRKITIIKNMLTHSNLKAWYKTRIP